MGIKKGSMGTLHESRIAATFRGIDMIGTLNKPYRRITEILTRDLADQSDRHGLAGQLRTRGCNDNYFVVTQLESNQKKTNMKPDHVTEMLKHKYEEHDELIEIAREA